MAYLRRLEKQAKSSQDINTFGDLSLSFLLWIKKLCVAAERIDFIFDTYVTELSVKDSERARRCNDVPIEISMISSETPLPNNFDTFWSSSRNKEKLLNLIRSELLEEGSNIYPGVKIVLSASGISGKTKVYPCQEITDKQEDIQQLDIEIEEADLRIIPHALHAASDGISTIIILSNDTDVLVATLYFNSRIVANGATKVWMRGGIGDSARFIPIDILAARMGPLLCKTLPALHALTGTDCTSKFGTKAAAVKLMDSTDYLVGFGETMEIDFDKTERFLVKLWKQDFQTLDELRFFLYHQQNKTICDLPPTSRATKAHILRAFYQTYVTTHCLTGSTIDPTEYGFYEDGALLKPIEAHVVLPSNMPLPCKCGICATNRCTCRKSSMPCCTYCKCAFKTMCKNPHVMLQVPVQM